MEKRDVTEESFESGRRAAWLTMLHTCLRSLGYDDPVAKSLRWVSEREGAIAKLREVCSEHGDNDWPNDLQLEDIIEKHLADHL